MALADREVWRSTSRWNVKSPESFDTKMDAAILLPNDREASGAGDVRFDYTVLRCRVVHSWMSAVVYDLDSLFLFFGMGIQFHTLGCPTGYCMLLFM